MVERHRALAIVGKDALHSRGKFAFSGREEPGGGRGMEKVKSKDFPEDDGLDISVDGGCLCRDYDFCRLV